MVGCYPEVGERVRCLVVKSSFTQAILKIIEVGETRAKIEYKAVLKGNSVGEEIYVCDSVKTGDIIDCIVISCGDNFIVVSKI